MTQKKSHQMDIQIVRLDLLQIQEVVKLHIECIPHTIPAQMGIDFLTNLYKLLHEDNYGIGFIAITKQKKLVGAITATFNIKKTLALQTKLIKQPKTLFYLMKAILTRKISFGDLIARLVFEQHLTQLTSGTYASILTLFVHPGFRRQGIAKKLVLKLTSSLPKYVTNLYVDTITNNKKAISLYRTLQFDIVKTYLDNTILMKKTDMSL